MKKSIIILALAITILLLAACANSNDFKVKTGLDRVEEYKELFTGKRIGIITNHTAYNLNDVHITEVFTTNPNWQVTALFGPEHGIRGDEAAGDQIDAEHDSTNEIPVYSLYGQNFKPSAEMLQEVDVLVFDIQDVGARFYTYISTMALAMEAAAEQGKQFVILDRPNPINGNAVEGNILEAEYSSFVGMFPIAVRHGMTIGELAGMINGEGWLENSIKCDLTVIPMQGWTRSMWFDQTGLKWRPPSPNIPDLQVAAVYPGTCLFEGTNISEGRGTYQPFLRLGAPWYSEESFSDINNLTELTGIRGGPITFVPKSIPGMAPSPKFQDEQITGISISVIDRENANAYLNGIKLVKYFYDAGKDNFQWRQEHFDRLSGTKKIRNFITGGQPLDELEIWLKEEEQKFRDQRQRYLIY